MGLFQTSDLFERARVQSCQVLSGIAPCVEQHVRQVEQYEREPSQMEALAGEHSIRGVGEFFLLPCPLHDAGSDFELDGEVSDRG